MKRIQQRFVRIIPQMPRLIYYEIRWICCKNDVLGGGGDMNQGHSPIIRVILLRDMRRKFFFPKSGELL